MTRHLHSYMFLASLAFSHLLNAAEVNEIITVDLEKPRAVIMGNVQDDHVRLNVIANPTSELCYGALQFKRTKHEGWGETITFPLARALYYSDTVDMTGLKSGKSYEYRVGTFHIPDQSLLPRVRVAWDEEGTANYDHELFYAYTDLVGRKDLCFLFGSCQYDGPLLDKLEKSPANLLNTMMKSKFLRKISFFTKLQKLPGYSKIKDTKLGVLIEVMALAEQEGQFFSTDDSETFRTVINYANENNLMLRGFIDMGDTYYRDWLNVYGGANNTEEIYALLIDSITTPGRHEIQKIMPTIVQIDDHAVKDNYTKNDLTGPQYSLFIDACWRMADIIQRQMGIYDPDTKQIGYRWREISLWGLPVFVGDFRSEMIPGIEKISAAQHTELEKFLKKWGNYPKVIVSQVPVGPDDTSPDTADKWGDVGYQATRGRILNFIWDHRIKNTFWLGGDIHSGLFADVVHTRGAINNNRIKGFPRTTDETEMAVDMTRIVLAESVASPFNWPIQFESLVLDPYMSLGNSNNGNFCIVNQSSLVKKNHAGIFKLSESGDTVEIILLANSPDNPSGSVELKKVYRLAPYKNQ